MDSKQNELPAEVRDVAEKVIDAYHTAGSHEKGILSGASVLAPLWPKQPQHAINAIFEVVSDGIIGTTLAKVKRVEQQDDGSLTVVIDHWPNPPQPSADVEKLAYECVHKCFEAELSYKEQVFLDRKKNEVSAILARAFAEKDAEIARLKDKHRQSPEYLSMLQAMLDVKARAERAEAELGSIRVIANRRNKKDHSDQSTASLVSDLDQVLGIVEATRDLWQLACAKWTSTICPKLNAHSLDEAETNLNALLAERDQLRDALTQAKDHIAIATHPELGWAVSEEEHNRVVAERDQLRSKLESFSWFPPSSPAEADAPHTVIPTSVLDALQKECDQLRAEVHGWRLIHSEPDKVVQELNQLRAEVEQWKTTAAKDREENVDMRNEIADLRAQLAELQRINQADYTEAGWQRARELEAQLTVAQEDEKRLDWLAMRWESQSHGPQTVSYTLVQVNGSFRAAIDAARKETRHE